MSSLSYTADSLNLTQKPIFLGLVVSSLASTQIVHLMNSSTLQGLETGGAVIEKT